ncbi:hypothetical protein C8Q79DRAFT_761141 [Trametes meyenii]|nr:hypothetical protein C8Q79DRAFT_761141 [Trametes meyenii]
MHNKITCIPYKDFMDEFLPEVQPPRPLPEGPTKTVVSSIKSRLRLRNKAGARPAASIAKAEPPLPPSPFKGMRAATTEKDMYTKITEALNATDPCPGFRFVPTPHKGDHSADTKQAVDCGMYPTEAAKKLKIEESDTFGWTAWSWVEIAIECKMNAVNDDPFDEDLEGHEPNAETRRHVLGQILSYAEYVFNHQQRMFQYMLLFLGDCARIVRIDRAGIFATKKFSYKKLYGGRIAQFLQRYAALFPTGRGHDPTAVRLDWKSDDAKMMLARVRDVDDDDYAAALFKKQLREDWPWWKLEVADELTGQTQRYLVGKPHFQAPGVAGRATRGYVALEADPEEGQEARFVYLKDSWRAVSDDIDKEGAVLQELGQHAIRFVPTLVCHGDILGQQTRTQEVWPKYHKGQECALKTHRHYRLVVAEVGKPLEEFSNGRELVEAFLCCVKAHSQAYQHDIIHRDISAGNMLLYKRPGDSAWTGLLNDWELSKHVEQREEGGRQPDRTGTWQFLSVNALNDHTKPIDIQDELESFFHVLLYICIRFLHHNLDDKSVPQFMRDYFDDFTPNVAGYRCGSRKHQVITSGALDLWAYHKKAKERLHFLWAPKSNDSSPSLMHPLDEVITTLLSWFGAYYTLTEQQSELPHEPPEDRGEPLELSPAIAWIIEDEARKEKQDAMADLDNRLSSLSTEAPKEDTRHASREELKQLAASLDTHQPMVQLLLKALLRMRWPESDRCSKDLEPKNWKAKVGQVGKSVQAAKAAKGSTKRSKGSKTPGQSLKVSASTETKVSTGSKRRSRAAGNTEAGLSTKRRKC